MQIGCKSHENNFIGKYKVNVLSSIEYNFAKAVHGGAGGLTHGWLTLI